MAYGLRNLISYFLNSLHRKASYLNLFLFNLNFAVARVTSIFSLIAFMSYKSEEKKTNRQLQLATASKENARHLTFLPTSVTTADNNNNNI